MQKALLSFTLSLFWTALLIAAVSVFIFHDVDHDQVGHAREAFAGLFVESILFAVIVGGITGILTSIGRHIFQMKSASPRFILAIVLGIGVPLLQYPWEFAVRVATPGFEQISLYAYLITAILVCSGLLLRDNYKQMRQRRPMITFD